MQFPKASLFVVLALVTWGCGESQAKAPDASSVAAVKEADAEFYAALNLIFEGDTDSMKEIWSHADDVTYLGPNGGFNVGWDQVLADWEKQAEKNLGGSVQPERARFTVGSTLAVAVTVERGKNSPGGEPQDVSIRATNVYRKEAGQWKMIGHHTDLLPFID